MLVKGATGVTFTNILQFYENAKRGNGGNWYIDPAPSLENNSSEGGKNSFREMTLWSEIGHHKTISVHEINMVFILVLVCTQG